MNDGTTVAGYIPFDPISSPTPMEHVPMNIINPDNVMNEAEMREFFAKVASAVVNASEQAKVIEAIRAQQVEDHARLHNLERLVSTHLQTIEALREAVREAGERRDDALKDYAEANAERITLRNELDVANDLIHGLEASVTNLLARNTELEAAAKGAQQTISDLQHTVYNLRDERRAMLETLERVSLERDAAQTLGDEQASMIAHYETQLDQVRKAIA